VARKPPTVSRANILTALIVIAAAFQLLHGGTFATVLGIVLLLAGLWYWIEWAAKPMLRARRKV
jgi:UPF0716 family protein affecting phage T7 exclusion